MTCGVIQCNFIYAMSSRQKVTSIFEIINITLKMHLSIQSQTAYQDLMYLAHLAMKPLIEEWSAHSELGSNVHKVTLHSGDHQLGDAKLKCTNPRSAGSKVENQPSIIIIFIII